MLDALLQRPSLHFTTLHPTTLHYTCRHFTSSHLNFTHLHFTPLHYTCRHFTSSHLNFTRLHFNTLSFGVTPFKFLTAPFHLTSLHSTSLHFTALLDIFATILFLSFHPVIIAFLTLFLKILGLRGKVPNASAGSWFQFLMALFTMEYFPISVLCFLSQIFRK
jgi:hypothetical protein